MRLFPPSLDLVDEEVLPGGALFRVRQVGQVVQGNFSPGAGGVAAGGAQFAEGPGGKIARILADAVIAENHDQTVLKDAPHNTPGNLHDPQEKFRQDHQNIRVWHPPHKTIDPLLAPLPAIEAVLKIAQHLQGKLGHLDAAHQGVAGKAEEIVKGPDIGFGGGPLEVVSVRFDGVKQGRS